MLLCCVPNSASSTGLKSVFKTTKTTGDLDTLQFKFPPPYPLPLDVSWPNNSS